MTVTVIIVNWNSGPFLARCLEHLQRQTIRPDRIIVVDNASSDGSAQCTLEAGAELFAMQTNLGFAAGNNCALAECDSDFVACLNPDAFPAPDWMERLLDAASAFPDVAAFGSRQLNADQPDKLDGIGDVYHISGLVWRLRYGCYQNASDMIAREIFSPCAAAALYRRSSLIEIGGFDEDFFCYVEDVDLGFRLRLAGYRAIYVPLAVVHHVGSASTGGQHSDFSIYHGHRNLVWVYVKNMPGALFWLLLPLHVLLSLVSIIWFAFCGQGGVILRAKRDAVWGLPRMWRKRQVNQNKRVATVRDIWLVLGKQILRR